MMLEGKVAWSSGAGAPADQAETDPRIGMTGK